jgi:hypothetical protein
VTEYLQTRVAGFAGSSIKFNLLAMTGNRLEHARAQLEEVEAQLLSVGDGAFVCLRVCVGVCVGVLVCWCVGVFVHLCVSECAVRTWVCPRVRVRVF